MVETTFFYTAAIGGTFLVIQLLMMFMGGDDSDFGDADVDADIDVDVDVEGHAHSAGFWFFEMVSLKTLAAAATFFGLTGMTALSYGFTQTTALLLGGGAGFIAMYCVYWLFKQLHKLQSTGTQRVRNAIGLPAQVYVPIPAEGSGLGKVHLTLQQRTVEFQALTDDGERLATGDPVVVVGIVNDDTVRVARQS
ncbi:MAG: hypothetical protein ACR2NU_04585 [Aeoliella sp.]